MKPDLLWAHAAARRVEQRLGWTIDVGREIVTHGRERLTDVKRDPRLERQIGENGDRWPWDSMGHPADDRASLGPIWKRWRIEYDQSFVNLTAVILQTLEAARES